MRTAVSCPDHPEPEPWPPAGWIAFELKTINTSHWPASWTRWQAANTNIPPTEGHAHAS